MRETGYCLITYFQTLLCRQSWFQISAKIPMYRDDWPCIATTAEMQGEIREIIQQRAHTSLQCLATRVPMSRNKSVFTGVFTRCTPAFLLATLVQAAKRCRMYTLHFTRHTLEISNFCERVRKYK